MGDGPSIPTPSLVTTNDARTRDGDGTGRRTIGGSLRGLEPFLDSPVRVARGATSVVYRARHRRLDQEVAVKVLDERHAADARIARRFAREGLVLASLRNDAIVRVIDRATTADGRPALILEWLDGPDVERRIRSHGPFTERQATPIIRQVVSALATIHRAGVVHRDVKPSNVVIVPNESAFRAVLLDFGVACGDDEDDTASGSTLGTPAFMAPEQARDASAVSASADVYAVGALYYTMVVGEPPHGRGDAWSQLHRMAEGYRASIVDAAPFVPRAIADVFDRCLSHDPSVRPKDGSALLAELDEALARPEVVLRGRTHPMRALGVAALATLGAGAFGARLVPEHGDASSLVLGVFVVLALFAIAGLALRERARFTDAGYVGRLDRLFYEAAPRAAIATTVAVVATAWADARGWLALDPVRASLAVGLGVFVLSVREHARPELGQIGRINVTPTSRSSASSLPERSSGGRSVASSSAGRGSAGSSSPS